MANIEDLKIGQHVIVTSRKNAPGVIVGFGVDSRGDERAAGTPTVRVQFGKSAGTIGFNWPDQITVPAAPESDG
jgi:hypothetical protein